MTLSSFLRALDIEFYAHIDLTGQDTSTRLRTWMVSRRDANFYPYLFVLLPASMQNSKVKVIEQRTCYSHPSPFFFFQFFC